MTHPAFTITASGLRDLLGAVLPFADDGSFPQLSSIWLRGHGDYVTATATDRYRLGITRVQVSAPASLAAVLPATSARQILSIFKATRTANPELTLTFEPSRVTVETSGGMDLLDARIGFPLLDSEYPGGSALKVLRDASEAEPGPIANVGFNPHFLADFRHLVSRGGPPMVIRQGVAAEGQRAKALFVAVGDDFRGVLMSLTRTDETTTDLSGSWEALVADVPKKSAARTKKAS